MLFQTIHPRIWLHERRVGLSLESWLYCGPFFFHQGPVVRDLLIHPSILLYGRDLQVRFLNSLRRIIGTHQSGRREGDPLRTAGYMRKGIYILSLGHFGKNLYVSRNCSVQRPFSEEIGWSIVITQHVLQK